jgi:4-carboxymuconolactone decarboxylase
LTTAEMNPAQKAVVDEIVSGKRGRFGGPFQLLIRAPEVCKHLSRLGEYLRWGSSLSPALSELAICLTARHIRANYEWHAHAPLAVEGGVPAAALEAIRTGATPHFAAKDQALVYKLVSELIDTKRLSDASFAEASPRSASRASSSSARSSATTPRSATRSTCSRSACRPGRRRIFRTHSEAV